jgi:hypothetical protein
LALHGQKAAARILHLLSMRNEQPPISCLAEHRTTPCGRQGIRRFIGAALLLTAFGLGWFGGGSVDIDFYKGDELATGAAVDAIVEKIIAVESNGDPNAKSKRSSALGLGQFLDETWLDLIRVYRPDLMRGRSAVESLELRRDASLAREITARLVERNAAMLRRRGLPVTPGTVYLAHFAGGAGAVAVLSAPEEADAASVMATSDATGRTKREQLVKANPFLEHFTVAELKAWADHKTRSAGL